MSKDKKTFSLKEIETRLLQVTSQQFQTIMSNQMALIAIERLAYNVTPQTRFTFNAEMTEVTITEDEPAEEEKTPEVVQ